MTDPVADLLTFIDRSPTPYHAVAESLRRLDAAGYQPLDPIEGWSLSPGDRRTLTRSDGSLIAFQVGSESPVDGGFRLVGAHTDSPNLRLKPRPDLTAQGYRQLSVEAYGALNPVARQWPPRRAGHLLVDVLVQVVVQGVGAAGSQCSA